LSSPGTGLFSGEMCPQLSKKHNGLPPSDEREFFIVGPQKLQNELIAACLEQETGDECFILEDINQIPKAHQKDHDLQTIVFWDCKGKDPNRLRAEIERYSSKKKSENHIVLFNVPSKLEFEKKFVLKGIKGFIYDHDPLKIFIKGVESILDGKLWFSRDTMTKYIFEGSIRDKSSDSDKHQLTGRQVEILALIAIGDTNDEIADKLCISPHTVKTHLYKIFRKINVPNRIQAALWAAKNL
jgi:LuxR family transcriptional regulator of csgAB operon